jgi:ribonuclease M5
MEKLKIPYPILVEGKYDKIKLDSVLEATVITTDGFRVFNNGEKLALVRALAKKTPIIVLTDSDGAGKLIRSHVTSALPKDRLIQLYIPKIAGKEKRKDTPSAEGTLGVEGMDADLLRRLFAPYAVGADGSVPPIRDNQLSKVDFYLDGLSGGEGSAARRDALAKRFGLPDGMTANALLSALRILCTYEEYCTAVGRKTAEN